MEPWNASGGKEDGRGVALREAAAGSLVTHRREGDRKAGNAPNRATVDASKGEWSESCGHVDWRTARPTGLQ